MLLFKKNRKLMEHINQYMTIFNNLLDSFLEGFNHALECGPDDQLETCAQRTHKLESNADDIRREIENMLYTESLLPEAREDLFYMLERIDKIPGKAESVLWQIYSQNMTIPEDYRDDFKSLAELSVETGKQVAGAVTDLFGKRKDIAECARVIDNNESLADGIERRMITKMFRSEGIDKSDRILLKELVIEVGHITDRCEEASDSICIFNTKRHI